MRECTCSTTQVLAYQKKLSGPLLDRIDLVVQVGRIDTTKLLHKNTSTNSQHTNAQHSIKSAQKIQFDRYNSSHRYNTNLSSREIKTQINLPEDVKVLLNHAAEKLNISARSYFKIIKIAQTIADLANSKKITKEHIAEALQYRQPTS